MTEELLDELSVKHRNAVIALGRRRAFERGEPLIQRGDDASWVILLLSGRVKVTATTHAGGDVILAFRGAGALLGEQALFDGGTRAATVSALERVEAVQIDGAAFRGFLMSTPAAAFSALRFLSGRLRDADRKRIEFASGDVTARVSTRLLELAQVYGVADEATGAIQVDLPLTQEDLAGWCGASLESTTRALRTLRQAGWITTGRLAVTILRQDELRRRAMTD